MDLFAPPAAKIRSRLPKYAVASYDKVVALAQERAPADLRKSERALVVGFIAAAWVASENRQGHLGLGPINGQFIQTTLQKCHQGLKSKGDVALSLVRQLHDEGIVALPPTVVL